MDTPISDSTGTPDASVASGLHRSARRIRRASGLVVIGLLIQLLAFLYWTPFTFIVFASLGVTLIVGGVGWYVVAIVLYLRERRAL
ncbi:MAG: hypothetical protein AAF735_05380 [Myxococcota bacterium]